MKWHMEPYTSMTALRGPQGPNEMQNWRERYRENPTVCRLQEILLTPQNVLGRGCQWFPQSRYRLCEEAAGLGSCLLGGRPPAGPVEPQQEARRRSTARPCCYREIQPLTETEPCLFTSSEQQGTETYRGFSENTRQAPNHRGGLLDTPTRPGEHRGPTALEFSRGTGYTRPGAGQETRCQLAATSRPGAVARRCRERLPLQPGPQDGDDVGSRAQLLCSQQGRNETIQPCCCSDARASAGHRAEKWPVRLQDSLMPMTTCPMLRGAHGATPQPPARRVRSDG